MDTMTHAIQTAGWRSDASRLRSRMHTCSNVNVTENAYGMKPAFHVSATAIVSPRRGAPPQ